MAKINTIKKKTMIDLLIALALIVFISSQVHGMILNYKRTKSEIQRTKLSIEVLKLELEILKK